MEAPDGGKIKVLLPPVRPPLSCPWRASEGSLLLCMLMYRVAVPLQPPVTHGVTDTYVEIVGSVVDASTLNFMTCINMGSQLGASCLPHYLFPAR